MRARRSIQLCMGTAVAVCAFAFPGASAAAGRHWGVCNNACPGFRLPTFAPDGTIIARTARGKLFRITLGDRFAVQAVGGGNWGRFALSPDGTRVAVGTGNGFAVGDLRTGMAVIADFESSSFVLFNPAWSPDGGAIAFQNQIDPRGDNRCCDLWMIPVDGIAPDPNGLRIVRDIPGAPIWTPDGTKIVTSGIRVVDVVSGDTAVIKPPELQAASAPDVSPNGHKIVFAGWRGSVPLLYVMNIDGSDAHAIGGEIYAPPAVQTFRGPLMTGPKWSPDGRKIAFLIDRTGRPELEVAKADGTGLRSLAEGVSARAKPTLTSFSWSPDSRTLAFLGGGDCSPVLGVFTVSVDGKVKRQLTRACRLRGTRRGETLIGSRYPDRIEALAGDDRILARNGKRDTVSCGSGRDTVVADRIDRIATDCERISRT